MNESLLDVDELTPGIVLGPFELLMPVGSGGMARVWAARTRANGKLVALKMLLSQLSEHLEFRKGDAPVAAPHAHPAHPSDRRVSTSEMICHPVAARTSCIALTPQ